MAKRTKTSVKKSLYKLHSQIVRTIHPGCIKCGRVATECHHLFGRANLGTAWDLRNGIPVCSSCHIFDKHSFEQAPYSEENMDLAREWIEEHGSTMEEIEKLSRSITKFSLEDLLDIELNLKNYLSQIQTYEGHSKDL